VSVAVGVGAEVERKDDDVVVVAVVHEVEGSAEGSVGSVDSRLLVDQESTSNPSTPENSKAETRQAVSLAHSRESVPLCLC
jgi:hypothetical protein